MNEVDVIARVSIRGTFDRLVLGPDGTAPRGEITRSRRLFDSFAHLDRGVVQYFVSRDFRESRVFYEFLNTVGRWSATEQLEDGEDGSYGAFVLTRETLQREQAIVKAIMTNQPFDGVPALQLLNDQLGSIVANARLVFGKAASLAIELTDFRSAIYAELWIGKARGVQYRFCKNTSCREGHLPGQVPFIVTRRDKDCCNDHCSHVHAQRNKRHRDAASRKARKKLRSKPPRKSASD